MCHKINAQSSSNLALSQQDLKNKISISIANTNKFSAIDLKWKALEKALCAHLDSLVLLYYSILSREKKMHEMLMKEELISLAIKETQVKQAAHISVLNLHLENETSSQVKIERLSPSHPQYLRCKRAVNENVKVKFFDHSPFNGINVLDIYKCENTVLLDRFQNACNSFATTSNNVQVKGLFCCVNVENVEKQIGLCPF